MTCRALGIIFSVLCLSVYLAGCGSCEKKPEVTSTATSTTPTAAKTQIYATRLSGLNLNGQTPEMLAKQSGDPALLEASDLAQYFQIFQTDYFEQVLKVVQSQIDSGKPLQGIYLLFGSAPKIDAVKCVLDQPGDTCLVEPVAFDCNEALPKKDWSEEIYAALCQSIGRTKVLQTKNLIAAFDADNTLWYNDLADAAVKRGVESGKIVWGESKAEMMSVYPPQERRKDYKQSFTPLQYYNELYDKAGPLFNYLFGALAFRGLTLNEAHAIYKDTLGQEVRPTAFPEMVDLLKYLQGQGVLTGIVSASPNFLVYPMAESLQTGIPLENIEGLDVLLRPPGDGAALPLRLSRLLVQGKLNEGSQLVERFASYQDFLTAYGTWVIVDVDPIVNARAGKSVAVRSIARRFVAKNNLNPGGPGNLLDVDAFRILLIGGDNFAAASDLPNAKGNRDAAARENGNDQGLSESFAFLKKTGNSFGGTDILYIRRFSLESDKQAYPKKSGLANFQAYIDQQRMLRPERLGNALVQPAVTDVKLAGGKGGFLKETPKTPESQPMPESAPTPTATPKPIATPVPGATPKPTAPGRPFGPIPADPAASPAPAAPAATPAPKPVASPPPIPAKPPVKLEPLPPGPPSDAL